MGFDLKRALAEIAERKSSVSESVARANPANRANPEIEPLLAQIARLARAKAQGSQNVPIAEQGVDAVILKSIDAGNNSHRAVSTNTKLGATVTYQIIERLMSVGRIIKEKDGVLKVMEQKNEP